MQQTKYCDFHCHLGGSTPPHILWELAYRSGRKLAMLSSIELEELMTKTKHNTTTHDEFLSRKSGPHAMVEDIQQGPDAVRRSCFEAVVHQYLMTGGKLQHIDMRFDPYRRGPDMLVPLIRAARQGLSDAGDCHGISTRLIVCADRREPVSVLWGSVRAAIEAGADGFDICGTETGQERDKDWIARNMLPPLHEAYSKGLFLTYHVGEARDTGMNVLNVLDVIGGVTRIGHGLDLLKSLAHIKLNEPEMERLRKVTFEVCPTACLRTETISKQELNTALVVAARLQIPVTINSDNPVLLGTNVAKEHDLVFQNMADCRWCDQDRKDVMEHLSTSRLSIL